MSVMESPVISIVRQTRFAAEYQSRHIPADRMISSFLANDRAKHSYFARCIAHTIQGHLDGPTSKLSTEDFPDPDDVVSDGYVHAAAPRWNGLHAINDAFEADPMIPGVGRAIARRPFVRLHRVGPHGSRRAASGAPHHEGLTYPCEISPRPEEPAEGGRLEGRQRANCLPRGPVKCDRPACVGGRVR
jgi:hypothetical protein